MSTSTPKFFPFPFSTNFPHKSHRFNFNYITVLLLALPTMEAFSFLKYWKGSGGGSGNTPNEPESESTTTIVTAVSTDEEENEDDGPFIDLEFAVPDEEEETEEDAENGSGYDGENGLDPNPDDVFNLVQIEPNSSIDSKLTQFPVSLMKSATKFRVFMLRFKKSKVNGASGEKTEEAENGPKKLDGIQEENGNVNIRSKFFTVKFKVEEVRVPIVSLFTRDGGKSQKQPSASEESVSDEKKFSKDVMQKYLKKVKPLYVRVSKRYGEKLRFSGPLIPVKPTEPPYTAEKVPPESEVGEKQTNLKTQKSVNIPAGLRVVRKHLGKSKSASSVVVAAPSPVLSQRRDDSLVHQLDGIQSAILHCKKSFNGSRDSDSSMLPRSVSDPSHEKTNDLSGNDGKC